MIVAIEGTSAAGKTTWCEAHAGGLCVPEAERTGTARWRRAVEIEAAHGMAVCDTDPAKLERDPATLARHRASDPGRRRHHFALQCGGSAVVQGVVAGG